MNQIISALLLLTTALAVVSHAAHLQDYRLPLAATPLKNCTAPGKLCESCTSLVACLKQNNVWRKTHIQTCPRGQKCIRDNCTPNADPICDGTTALSFPCRAVGVFPDPFRCDQFVMCVKLNGVFRAYPNTCEAGFGFNNAVGLCDTPLTDGQCPQDKYPVPLCISPGQSEALAEKPAMYYLCEEYNTANRVLYPFLNLCPAGTVYDQFECTEATPSTGGYFDVV